MSILGTPRDGVAAAPGALSVVQELLNTASAGSPRLPALLTERRLAGEWLHELRASVAASLSGRRVAPIRAGVRLELDLSGAVEALESDHAVTSLLSTVLVRPWSRSAPASGSG